MSTESVGVGRGAPGVDALVLYATSEGHTATIAERIAQRLAERGDAVEIHAVAEAPEDLSRFALIIVGASIHVGKHQPEVVSFTKEHLDDLQRARSAFFSVSMTSSSHTPEAEQQADEYVQAFTQETGWQPDLVGLFGGALLYTQYGFVKRRLIKTIAKKNALGTDTHRDYDYTDWDDVDHFAMGCAALVVADTESARGDIR